MSEPDYDPWLLHHYYEENWNKIPRKRIVKRGKRNYEQKRQRTID